MNDSLDLMTYENVKHREEVGDLKKKLNENKKKLP